MKSMRPLLTLLVFAPLLASSPSFSADHHPQPYLQDRKFYLAKKVAAAVAEGKLFVVVKDKPFTIVCALAIDALKHLPHQAHPTPAELETWFQKRRCLEGVV